MNQAEMMKQIEEHLRTPQDISQKTNEEKASMLALHFIGYIAKPTGISEELYRRCVEAFGRRRGKIEWEIEEICKELDKTSEALRAEGDGGSNC